MHAAVDARQATSINSKLRGMPASCLRAGADGWICARHHRSKPNPMPRASTTAAPRRTSTVLLTKASGTVDRPPLGVGERWSSNARTTLATGHAHQGCDHCRGYAAPQPVRRYEHCDGPRQRERLPVGCSMPIRVQSHGTSARADRRRNGRLASRRTASTRSWRRFTTAADAAGGRMRPALSHAPTPAARTARLCNALACAGHHSCWRRRPMQS